MKSIAEISKELNITPQAVYKKINNQLKTQLKDHVHKGSHGKTMIDAIGETIIKSSLNQGFQPNSQPVENQLKINDDFVELLKEQLKVKDEQIQELLNQNGSLIKKIENMQVLLKTEQDKPNLISGAEENSNEIPKKSFWKKLLKG